jgi:hypothetical protein
LPSSASDTIGYFPPNSDNIDCFPVISAYRVRGVPIGFVQSEPIRFDNRIT